MAVHAETSGHGAHGGGFEPAVSHQFEDIAQQNECYIVGMWSFLVTEIMFFGALFLALTIYRGEYYHAFHLAHHELNVPLGTLNTFVLLFSSLTMALGVRAAMLGPKARPALLRYLGLTMICAFVFLGVKTVEYSAKFHHHLVPGSQYRWPPPKEGAEEASGKEAESSGAIRADEATQQGLTSGPHELTEKDTSQIFFSLYFAMTGLHAIHIIVGILIIGTVFVLVKFNHPSVVDYMPIELTGLYWHFVDIVWIFLFPIIYLLG